jgi:hypothetical protein
MICVIPTHVSLLVHLHLRSGRSIVAPTIQQRADADLRTQRWATRRSRLEQLAADWSPPLQLTSVTYDAAEARECHRQNIRGHIPGTIDYCIPLSGRREPAYIRRRRAVAFDDFGTNRWLASQATVEDRHVPSSSQCLFGDEVADELGSTEN